MKLFWNKGWKNRFVLNCLQAQCINVLTFLLIYHYCCVQELGLAVVGSQIVGLVPLKAMLQVADHYAVKENLFLLEEDQKIRLVVDRLGLHSVGAFSPKERVIEYVYELLVGCHIDVGFVIESSWVQLHTIPVSCNDFGQVVHRHFCPKVV